MASILNQATRVLFGGIYARASPAYKRRGDFPDDHAYGRYVIATAQYGMTVELTVDYGSWLRKGDRGVVRAVYPGAAWRPLKVAWARGTTLWVEADWVDILG